MPHQADREANRALRARFDDVRAQYDQLRTGMNDLQRRLADLTATAESPDGLVHATVGRHGRLVDLRLDPGIYRDNDPAALARTILQAVELAAARTDDSTDALLAEYLPATEDGSRR